MALAEHLALLRDSQLRLATAMHEVAGAHAGEADVRQQCDRLAAQCEDQARGLERFVDRHARPDTEHVLDPAAPARAVSGDLLLDLQHLYVLASGCDVAWTLVVQAAQGARDGELLDLAGRCEQETAMQLRWLRTRLKQAAPQALVVS